MGVSFCLPCSLASVEQELKLLLSDWAKRSPLSSPFGGGSGEHVVHVWVFRNELWSPGFPFQSKHLITDFHDPPSTVLDLDFVNLHWFSTPQKLTPVLEETPELAWKAHRAAQPGCAVAGTVAKKTSHYPSLGTSANDSHRLTSRSRQPIL